MTDAGSEPTYEEKMRVPHWGIQMGDRGSGPLLKSRKI